MSWGERSCGQGRPCGYNPTILTCNVNCPGYRWDGYTKPDSGELPPLTKTQLRLMRAGKPEERREYILDRYHDGIRMAEGARVTASSLEEAIERARHLPGSPRFTHDNFRERRIDEATP